MENAKNNKAKYIHNVKRSSLLEIVEKSFPTMYGEVSISDRDDSVFIKVATPNQKGIIANVTFYDYDVKIESPIDFPRNEDTLEIRFLDLMAKCFDNQGYTQDWEAAHAKKQAPATPSTFGE